MLVINIDRPWILEINLCPSLACETLLDFSIKSKLITDTLNLVSLNKPHKREYYAKIQLKNSKGIYVH